MRISDWSSDVCSSDLLRHLLHDLGDVARAADRLLGDALAVDIGARKHRFEIRSEERRVGKSVSVRVDLGGRRIIKKKNKVINNNGATHPGEQIRMIKRDNNKTDTRNSVM